MSPPAGSPFDRYHNTTNDEPDCWCSHCLDEHDENLACTVGGCGCSYYDEVEEDEEEVEDDAVEEDEEEVEEEVEDEEEEDAG